MAAFATDIFTETGSSDVLLENHTATGGGTWSKLGVTGEVLTINHATGDFLYPSATVGSATPLWAHSATPPSADYDVQVDVHTANASAYMPGPAGRIADIDNFYFVCRDASTWYLRVRYAGTNYQLGSYAGDDPNTTRTVLLRLNGTSIKVFIGGVERISVTDSNLSAAGKAGIAGNYEGNSTGSTNYLDNWTATPYPDSGGVSTVQSPMILLRTYP
jgi:hypothetical protein